MLRETLSERLDRAQGDDRNVGPIRTRAPRLTTRGDREVQRAGEAAVASVAMSRKLKWGGALALLAILGAFGGGLWSASNQLLFPSWRGATKDLSVCGPELAKYWGEGCGNLRTTHELRFSEVKVPSLNGYDLPGWLIGAADNGAGPAEGAIMLIHGGGSDRRELTRHARFYLGRRLDVLTLDVGCDGEAPCPVPGLTYGQRESRDVLSAYLFLTSRYDKVLAMGSSVGAASILVALPEMPKLKGVIAENPMASFQKLIAESPAARSIPSPRRMAAPRPPGFQTRASTAPSGMLITSTNSSQ